MTKKILRTVFVAVDAIVTIPIKIVLLAYIYTFICLSKNREELLDSWNKKVNDMFESQKKWINTGE